MTEDTRGARYRDLFEEAHEHTSDCAYCPICATIGALRNSKPEVFEHLAAAARELVLAAGVFLEQASEGIGDKKDEGDGDEKLRHIEVI